MEDAIGAGGYLFVVGDDDEGGMLFALNLEEEIQDMFGISAVQIAGGFIGKQDFWAVDERASDCSTLELSAGESGRFLAELVSDADKFGSGADAGLAVTGRDPERHQRHLQVLGDGEMGLKVEELKDKAKGAVAQVGEGGGAEATEILTV